MGILTHFLAFMAGGTVAIMCYACVVVGSESDRHIYIDEKRGDGGNGGNPKR